MTSDLLTKKPVVTKPESPQELRPIVVKNLPCPPEGMQWFVWDEKITGFGVRLNPESRIWVAQARDPSGKSVRRTIGSVEEVTLADARKDARKIISDIEAGKTSATLRRRSATTGAAVAGVPTFRECRDGFIEWARENLRSWDSYRNLLHRPELAELEGRVVAEITRADISRVFQSVVKTVKANEAARNPNGERRAGELRRGVGVTANRMLSALSGVFGWAAEHYQETDPRLLGHNPALGWKKLRKVEADREVLIDPADVPAIWRAFDVARAPWPAAFKLCLLTAARRGEIQGLKWDDLRDLDGPDARAELRSRTKAGKELDRVIALTPMAVEILRSVPRTEGAVYVFGKVRPLPDDSGIDADVRKASGLAYHWTVYAFRHLFATWAHDKAGALSDEVRGVLGQVISGAFGKYAKRPPVPRMRALLENWAQHLRAIGCR